MTDSDSLFFVNESIERFGLFLNDTTLMGTIFVKTACGQFSRETHNSF